MLDEKCKVLVHQEIGSGYRYLIMEAPKMAAELVPGQFVHVKVPALEMSALRRPFSVFDATDGMVVILYKTVGRGTAALNGVQEGDEINILGPLGHGFPTECSGTALLVGGGFGVADPCDDRVSREPKNGTSSRVRSYLPGQSSQTRGQRHG